MNSERNMSRSKFGGQRGKQLTRTHPIKIRLFMGRQRKVNKQSDSKYSAK